MLNKPMTETGKAAVVNYISTSSPNLPRNYFVENDSVGFNKFSGVLQFQNAIVLWVNFSGKSCSDSYENEFLENGREFTWFGGSKMTGDSPVIKRLAGSGEDIILWTRFCDGSKTSPYVCLGRLEYVSHDEEVHPVKFVWRLKDYEELVLKKEGKKKGEKSLFQQFVDFK